MTVVGPCAAGVAALRAGQWETARSAFEASLAEGDSAEAFDGLAHALWWLGDTRGSVANRERAYAAYREAGDRVGCTAAAVTLSIHYKASLGNQPASAGWIARAERLVEELESGSSGLAGRVMAARAYQTSDSAHAVAMAERALRLGREHHDPELELISLGQLGRALVEVGRAEEGMALLDEGMAGALGGECENLDVVVLNSCAMLNACETASDLERAAHWCREAVQFTGTYGCPFLYAECRMLYGGVLVATGDWEGAETELDSALRVSGDAHPALRRRTLARLAELRLRQGMVEQAQELVDEVADPLATALTAATIHWARAEYAAATDLCEYRITAGTQRHLDIAPLLGLLVRVHLARERCPDARAAAAELAALGSGAADIVSAHALLAGGRVASAEGDTDDATGKLERAVRLFRRLGLPLETAQARVELARCLSASHRAAAVAEARAALTVADRLGARAEADGCAALLRSLGVRTPSATRGAAELTRREQDVLDLLAAGLSNPEIARRLFISRKTAAHHVSNVLGKLGYRNRTEAATAWSRHPVAGI